MAADSPEPPLDAVRELLAGLPPIDSVSAAAVRARDAELTKPAGSLGRIEGIAEWMAGWQGRARPTVSRPLVAVFATNHGIADRGVSAFPQSVTAQMVANFAAGGAAINQICRAHDLGLKVFELALEQPTPDVTVADAFDERGLAATIAFGMEAIADGVDLLCLGEMGIANTTIAAGIYHALYGGEAENWVGRGTGVDDAGLARKAHAVRDAVARLRGSHDPFEILRRIGGREIAALVGAMIAARVGRVPVIVDGFVTTAAAALLHAIRPDAIDHCLFAHRSAEAAHAAVLAKLGQSPLLDLGMRLGEGTGGALAAGIVKAAVAVHNGMATFGEAGVSDRGA